MLPPRPLYAVIMPDGYRWSVHHERELAEKAADAADMNITLRVVKYLPVKSRRQSPECPSPRRKP